MNAVEVKDLTKKFGDHVLFSHAECVVRENEIIGLYGASGSGKSTFLNILAGIEPFQEGSVLVFGHPVGKGKQLSKMLREEYGILFQNYALIDNMSVKENVRIAQRFSKDRSDQALSEALRKVGLEDFENKKIYELSGGEQQRVAIARLIVKPCRLVLADEPTGNVDAGNREVIMKLFGELKEMGKTILVVTHDESLKKYFDKVFRIENGTIQEVSKAERVLLFDIEEE